MTAARLDEVAARITSFLDQLLVLARNKPDDVSVEQIVQLTA